MKKVILLVSCLAVLASCGKKSENAANEAAQTATEVAAQAEEVATQVAEVAKQFLDADKINAKSFGLRQNEEGVWELNLKALDENGETAGELQKIAVADDAEIITLNDGTILGSALNDEVKKALNNKFAPQENRRPGAE